MGREMKMFVGIAVFVWLLCGLAGAWMLEGANHMHARTIIRGPISLIKAINDAGTPYPTQV